MVKTSDFFQCPIAHPEWGKWLEQWHRLAHKKFHVDFLQICNFSRKGKILFKKPHKHQYADPASPQGNTKTYDSMLTQSTLGALPSSIKPSAPQRQA